MRLRGILDRVPPDADGQGFRRGHSVLTNARRHVGQRVVIGFDLEEFFASVEASRVYGIFRGALPRGGRPSPDRALHERPLP
jgi:RNA-directed DNA polymerase